MKKLYCLVIGLIIISFNSCATTDPDPGNNDTGYHNKILFTSRVNEREQLFMMNPDGTDIKQITSGQYWHNRGRWSPDGQKIICNTEEKLSTAGIMMVVMNIDGTDRKLIGPGNFMNWSPNNKEIVFCFMPAAELGFRFEFIYTINADGSGIRRITRDSLEMIYTPCWANGGNKIYFVSNRHNVTNYNGGELYYMNKDGSDVTRLTYTPNGNSYSPAISPSNGKIVFMSTMNGASKGSIYICDIDGGNIDLLVTPPETEIYNFPRWSPDEQYIIFMGGLINSGGLETAIYKIDINGNNLIKLADNASYPDWIKSK